MARLTLNQINAELARLGYEERLARGHDYFFFYDGNAHNWCESGVYGVYRLSALSLEQWISERNQRNALWESRRS